MHQPSSDGCFPPVLALTVSWPPPPLRARPFARTFVPTLLCPQHPGPACPRPPASQMRTQACLTVEPLSCRLRAAPVWPEADPARSGPQLSDLSAVCWEHSLPRALPHLTECDLGCSGRFERPACPVPTVTRPCWPRAYLGPRPSGEILGPPNSPAFRALGLQDPKCPSCD